MADSTVHIPILVEPIVNALYEGARAYAEQSTEPAWILDATFGGGGHTAAILARLAAEKLQPQIRVHAVDRDREAIERGQVRFRDEIQAGMLRLEHRRWETLPNALQDERYIGLLADLGFSSDQLDRADRGLSFRVEGPLDMRLDPESGPTARELLESAEERQIADWIYEYGEERFSRRIASAIVRARSEQRLPKTTTELADLIWKAVPGPARSQRLHPATRTFQALRIAVNGELEELDLLIQRVIPWILPGGVVAVLSFHSLEDRRVKLAFRDRDGIWVPMTKKPLEPSDVEIQSNSRARSAKLRIAVRKGGT
jgi:16S rRNA (cytosine1402-N4)-methyltransferase